MEIKRNEATPNRPEGNRIIDAPYVFIDIPQLTQQLTSEKAWQANNRNGITAFKSGNLAVVVVALKADTEIVENTVDGYIMALILSGSAQVVLPDGEMTITQGQAIVLHPGQPHTIRATSDTLLLLTNSATG